jgi:outer membrane biosynthesis protein TonB
MLPIEPKSDLTLSQADKPMLNSALNPMLKFAGKTGSLILKYPFWVLVVSSVGIHTAFAFITPNLLKKTEPTREVVISTLPVVKLPPKSLSTKPKSLFDNLFVKSPTTKIGSPLNTAPNKFPSILSTTPQSTFDLSTFDSLEDLPPLANDFSFSVPPLSNSPRQVNPSQFVKPQTPEYTPQTPPTSRFTPSGKIDNTTPVNTPANGSSNIKPEFQNGGLQQNMASSPITKNTNPDKVPDKAPNKIAKNLQGTISASSANTDRNEKEIDNMSSLYSTDKQIIDLVSKNLIRATQIAPSDALIPYPDLNREKGVTWIPAKVTNVSEKKGSVTFMWLVDPNGEVQTRFLKSSGIKELDDIARETVKDYKFKPIEDPASGKYRLVTARYDFP